MYAKIKNFTARLFDSAMDFRIRLFTVLAIAGVCISAATLIVNIINTMWTSTILSALLTVLSAGILIFTYKTGKYQIGYTVTIIVIFMILFPILFLSPAAIKAVCLRCLSLLYCLPY